MSYNVRYMKDSKFITITEPRGMSQTQFPLDFETITDAQNWIATRGYIGHYLLAIFEVESEAPLMIYHDGELLGYGPGFMKNIIHLPQGKDFNFMFTMDGQPMKVSFQEEGIIDVMHAEEGFISVQIAVGHNMFEVIMRGDEYERHYDGGSVDGIVRHTVSADMKVLLERWKARWRRR